VTTRRAGRAYYVIKPVREALILDQPGGAGHPHEQLSL
jgi:hypothetical protein